jgi:hypothetical protein
MMGRWLSIATAKIYLREAQAEALGFHLSDRQKRALEKGRAAFVSRLLP